MPVCPYCGSENTEYAGVDDGGGDYGMSVCDQWGCVSCGQTFEDGCIDGEPGEESFDPEVYGNKDISDDLGDLAAGWEL